ncbi:4-hydroxythreonine-4-phosphate dehydrogenase PdxA [Candidatus Ichthyocystis hellenicum]|uniref:4-hydroxythreonine-4-phosphate dehydrogenase PdxA n=1 Tax=Candidatus Ichthyocystis hellenicum TaxID=1561003 RepID=UPI000B078DC1|nr:4-hydroxythreonine-4-phosphate dehydrogenase PdxA [Candidatus Ichthyocystis hellenicum]
MNRIIITAGEPAGIGPDLCVMLAQQPCPNGTRLIVIADPDVLESRACQLHMKLEMVPYETNQEPNGKIEILPIKYPESVVPGKLDPRNSPTLLASIDRAIHGCRNDEFTAMVTNPVNKATIMDAGLPFVDHTSYLRKKCKAQQVVMVLFGNRKWCVALMTTHIPIKDVSRSLSIEHVSRTLSVIDHDFSLYLGKKPKIGVCGLNPHAGEDGHIGREEIEIISPAILDAQNRGISCLGPLSGDTIFCDEQRRQFDVILASYHDQGLAPFKLANAFTGTNVTFGLPIIRTSVDHGTAVERAGQGNISSSSLEVAVQRAIQFCISKKNHAQG